MAKALMSHPCGESCNKETEFKVSFIVSSLEMTDKEKDRLFSEILIVITWDGNVVKLTNTKPEAEEFEEEMHLILQGTPVHISEKLKTCPIMINLSRGCTELGTIKLPISDCFADAVLCTEFNSQTVSNEFKFVKDNQENATMNSHFRVQRLLDDGIAENLLSELKLKRAKYSKKLNKAVTDSDDDASESDENEPCQDFACPDEQAQHCKEALGLDQNIYRIINGILINTKDKIGPCGERCPVGEKYSKKLRDEQPKAVQLLPRFEFDRNASKCTQLFDNYCNGQNEKKSQVRTNITSPPESKTLSNSRKPCRDDWIDKNIREEEVLKKLCEKHGISLGDVIGQKPVAESSCKKKIRKLKKRSKKFRKLESTSTNVSGCRRKEADRDKFIEKMKRKSRGVYSYDFGSSYPPHRTFSANIEQGAGDSAELVPRNMGWRWDNSIIGIGEKKWYPGHINRTVRCLMKHCLNPYPYDTIPLTRRDKTGKIIKSSINEPNLLQKPTLLIQKRDGSYSITLHPLKDKSKLSTDVNPYYCMPLNFQIKLKPEEVKKHRAKKLLRIHGFVKKCSCLDLKCCRCMSENAKKLLAFEIKNISKMMKLEQQLEFGDLDESSDSELEMEFTTPSGIIDRRKLKPDVVHCGTQYSLKDFIPPSRAKKVEENPGKSVKKPKTPPPKPIRKPKPKRRIESLYLDPPCNPVSIVCQPKCATVRQCC